MNFSDLEKFNFILPPERIRNTGVEPRDSARLFVYDTASDTVSHDIFKNIGKYLPIQSTLVFNETKVLPARLWLHKETGGKIEVFILINEWRGDKRKIPALVDRGLNVGQELHYAPGIFFVVTGQKDSKFILDLHDTSGRSLEEILLQYGETPIPPYIKGNKQNEGDLRKRYQTVVAKKGSSVAAPTAALHFTDELLSQLQENGVQRLGVSLEVGLGTFAPLQKVNFEEAKLHAEVVTFQENFLTELKAKKMADRKIVAVGTTSLRALETIAKKNVLKPGAYTTDIFITPGFPFQYVDCLITNFHTPKSSLLLLVEAFLKHKKAKRGVMDLYQEAMHENYFFYSFGDSMLIL